MQFTENDKQLSKYLLATIMGARTPIVAAAVP